MGYEGPAALILTDEEWLKIWQALNRNPVDETESLRRRIKKHLEARKHG